MFFLLLTTNAYALGIRSTTNCGVDYFKYCSQYAIGSDEVRECFRRNGHNLSSYCVDALLADGEVTKEEVDGEREKLKQKQEEVKPVEEPVKPKEEIPIATPETKFEPIIIGEKPEPEKVKSSILQYIAKRVAAKLKEPVTKNESIAAKVAEVVKTRPSRSRKVQRGGKWNGYPLYLEWNNNRELGGEITPYGLEDRR